MNNDAAFLSLLTSQRELLNQLNLENALHREQGRNHMLMGKGDMLFQPEAYAANSTSFESALQREQERSQLLMGKGDMLFQPEAFVSNNTSISERRSSIDSMLFSKRFSIGMGSDNLILPDTVTKRLNNADNVLLSKRSSLGMGISKRSSLGMGISKRSSLGMGFEDFFLPSATDFPESDNPAPELMPSRDGAKNKRGKFENGIEQHLARKKRRLSSLEFLSPNFFDEVRHYRRLSMASQAINNTVPVEDTSNKEVPVEPVVVRRPRFDAYEVRSVMEAFSSAMERSQKSQQDIHDWDRKMGLKRSHSKTMRLSTRSRKKLRSMLKKQINALPSQSH